MSVGNRPAGNIRECDYRDCGKPFHPVRKTNRFCSLECRRAEEKLVRAEQREEWAEFYASDGCHLFHRCLDCPFSMCVYDDEEKVTAEALAMGIVPKKNGKELDERDLEGAGIG